MVPPLPVLHMVDQSQDLFKHMPAFCDNNFTYQSDRLPDFTASENYLCKLCKMLHGRCVNSSFLEYSGCPLLYLLKMPGWRELAGCVCVVTVKYCPVVLCSGNYFSQILHDAVFWLVHFLSLVILDHASNKLRE